MKFHPSLIVCLALVATTTVAFAATKTPAAPAASTNTVPATNASAATPANGNTNAASKAPKSTFAPLKLEDYINDMATTLKLSDADKKSVEDIYVSDNDLMKAALNDDTLSPLQQAQKVADLRGARNAKIAALLIDPARNLEFLKVEAKYRVALTELAADGGWGSSTPPAPAQATNAPATNAPAASAPAGTAPATNAPAAKAP